MNKNSVKEFFFSQKKIKAFQGGVMLLILITVMEELNFLIQNFMFLTPNNLKNTQNQLFIMQKFEKLEE